MAPGDVVLARRDDDPEAPVEPRAIEECFNRFGRVCRLTIAGREILTSPEHPFWVKHRGWTPAVQLEPGQLVAGLAGTWHAVEALDGGHALDHLFNFRIAEFATYFVATGDGTDGIWAHNACVTKNSDGSYDIELKYKSGWDSTHQKMARIKVHLLNENLPMVKPATATPRVGTIQKKAAKSMGLKGSGFDVDHIIDLQLGGLDEIANIWPLLRSVNRSFGPQISHALQQLPADALIRKIVISSS